MPRYAVVCASLGLSAITACAPGDYQGQAAPSSDAPVVRGADATPSASADAAPEATIACVPTSTDVRSGEHHAGDACQRCHDGRDGDAPLWSLGGTLFDGLASTTPVSGATIVVDDAAGQHLELTTARNGNFWTATPLTFPITVAASRCPSTLPMVSPVATPGDCNAGGCHDSDYRIFLR